MQFDQLGLRPEILRAVKFRGYSKPTSIQEQAVPAVLAGKDVLGGAQTGTGKTAAFALPILEKLSSSSDKGKKHPRALVLTPTRELADQVGESFFSYGRFVKLKTAKIFGGVKINPHIDRLKSGADIVVATPGRLMDHLNQRTINLSFIEVLVLDEADRMLDMGFIKDIKKIIQSLPSQRQNLLFSATYGNEIRALASDIMKDPVEIEVAPRNTAAETVEQKVHFINKDQKRHLLAHLIQQLQRQGISTAAIHGDKSQSARNSALKRFKSGDVQALVATDIASRGLQLDGLDHVVNFDLPNQPEDYIHRIGRTGRAGKNGTAVSLISPDEKIQLKRIQTLLKNQIPVEHVSGFKPVALSPEEIHPKPFPQEQSRKKRSPGVFKKKGY